MELAQASRRLEFAVLTGRDHLLSHGFDAHIAYLSAALAVGSQVDTDTAIELARIFLEGYLEVEDPHLTYASEVTRQVLYLRAKLPSALVDGAMCVALSALASAGRVPQTINLDEFAFLLKLHGTTQTILSLVGNDYVPRDQALYLLGCALEWGKLLASEVSETHLASVDASFLPLVRWGDRVSGARWEQITPPWTFASEPLQTSPSVNDHAGTQTVRMQSRGFRLAHFERATATGGSSLTRIGDDVGYCDFLDYEQSASASCASDSLLAGFSGGSGLVRENHGDALPPIKVAISLLGSVNLEHGHLVLDTLSRLAALEGAGLADIPILIDESPNTNAICFISRFVDIERLVVIPRGSRVRVDRLVRPLPTTYSPPGINDWDLCIPGVAPWDPRGFEFVQQRMRPSRSLKQPPRRVFIYREASNQRRALRNQQELVELTRRFGYESVDPGGLSADAQMALFADANHIIVQSGAAAFNVIACHQDTKIAVLIGDDLSNWRGFASPVAQAVDEITFITGVSLRRPIPDWQVPFEIAECDLLHVLERWHAQDSQPMAPNPNSQLV